MNGRLRWLKKFGASEEVVLQEELVRKYDDGHGHIDEIEEWVDVPMVVEVNTEGETMEM